MNTDNHSKYQDETPYAITPSQLQALTAYASKYGRTWKAELRYAWMNGADCHERSNQTGEPIGHLLRQVRNQFGPSWLVKFSFNKPSTHISRD